MPGTSGSQHYRAAHRHCRTPDPMWHPSCVSHPYMDPGWHRHPCQHAHACKHATRVQKHTPLLPNTCSGMALLQHHDPVTSATQECMSVRVRKLPLGTLAGGQLWTQPLQPVQLLTHPHAHTATYFCPTITTGGVLGALWVPRLMSPASLVPCHQVPSSVTSSTALSISKG